jgi:formylglycine-generating enzyme required for sulfatase activity
VREHDAMIVTAARYHPNAPVLASGTHVFDTGEVFRDCSECPEMVIIPAGGFTMGSPASENKRDDDEGPQHHVDIASFAAGRFPITFDEWDACVAAGGCGLIPPADDNKWGRGRRPVIYVSWRHAEAYAQWLSQRTHQHYRLMSEAEWEYAARAGSTGIAPLLANVNGRTFTPHDRHVDQTLPVGSYTQNAFGLYDMLSNVGQWVEDPYLPDYSHAPSDGSAAHSVDVGLRLSRGGPYSYAPERLRVANRSIRTVQNRGADLGFRVARDIAM